MKHWDYKIEIPRLEKHESGDKNPKQYCILSTKNSTSKPLGESELIFP